MGKVKINVDVESMTADLVKTLTAVSASIQQEMINLMQGRMKTSGGSSAVTNDDLLVIDTRIHFTIKSYALAVLDSYGTGTAMDVSNEYLAEYLYNSITFNPLRSGLAITGRPEGTYIDIFGNEVRSSGSAAGVNLEALGVVKPRTPSFAIQETEYDFFTVKIKDRIGQEVNQWLKRNAYKYFSN